MANSERETGIVCEEKKKIEGEGEQIAVLTADKFLSFSVTLQTRDVPIPEWGEGQVARIRELTGKKRDEVDYLLARGKKQGDDFRDSRAKIAAKSLIDAAGNLLFDEVKDLQKINTIPGKILERIVSEIFDLNGLTEEAEKKEGNG